MTTSEISHFHKYLSPKSLLANHITEGHVLSLFAFPMGPLGSSVTKGRYKTFTT